MTSFTIIGTGNMGSAIGSLLAAGGNDVTHISHEQSGVAPITGDFVVLAVPYPAVSGVLVAATIVLSTMYITLSTSCLVRQRLHQVIGENREEIVRIFQAWRFCNRRAASRACNTMPGHMLLVAACPCTKLRALASAVRCCTNA